MSYYPCEQGVNCRSHRQHGWGNPNATYKEKTILRTSKYTLRHSEDFWPLCHQCSKNDKQRRSEDRSNSSTQPRSAYLREEKGGCLGYDEQ